MLSVGVAIHCNGSRYYYILLEWAPKEDTEQVDFISNIVD